MKTKIDPVVHASRSIVREISIRPIRPSDNPAVAQIIRRVMTEYGAVGCGYSINDVEVDAMYETYPSPHAAFFVIERKGEIQATHPATAS